MLRFAHVCAVAVVVLCGATRVGAGDRVPTEVWMRYTDVRQAGFDADRLEAARRTWETLPSSSFLIVADGAVVADWGDSERRFMCHSVRKSFLAALYGIYYDRGQVDLNKTLADLGIDDEPEPLLETEKRARILDLLKARSGVFHPAAYAGRTDSRPRGSEGPGRYFAYNNWDFNTLATILMQITNEDVFEAFTEYFAEPLHMQDWRVTDGYYHYERDKSKYPAYPFRMSARDAARVGVLFAREGLWGRHRILSRNWVRRCTAEYSIDDEVRGYGFMWWTYREPRFLQYGMVSALGVGNQMIAVLPDIDMVIVNRANTYDGEGTPNKPLLDLIEAVLQARTGTPVDNPSLEPMPTRGDARLTDVAASQLAELEGEWSYPPPSLGLAQETTVTIEAADGHVISYAPVAGTFRLYLQPDGLLYEEDTKRSYAVVRTPRGKVDGIAGTADVTIAAVKFHAKGDTERSAELARLLATDPNERAIAARAVLLLSSGNTSAASDSLRKASATRNADLLQRALFVIGYNLAEQDAAPQALRVLELTTDVFPDNDSAWHLRGEVHVKLGQKDKAADCFEKSLALNPENRGAQRSLAELRGEEEEEE